MLLWITTVEIRTSRSCHYYCKTDRDKSPGRPAVKKKTAKKENRHQPILCKACGRKITTAEQAIAVNSSFQHTFFNPAGIVFELGCYRRAEGAGAVGQPSSEFSWFSGYLWSFALCSGCQTHLGWYFESASDGFWGLILNRLRE